MNGQAGRKAMVQAIIERVAPSVIVETGTHRGRTSRHLARTTGLPVHTVEVDERTYRRARRWLRGVSNVHMNFDDSRAFLRGLPDQGVSRSATVLFYLDAHWREDLPLAEELEIIEQTWGSWVAVVDDFEVPDDAGYGFDDYGPGMALRPAYLAAHGITASRLHEPVLPSALESGARRGCVVLASPDLDLALDDVALLRRIASD